MDRDAFRRLKLSAPRRLTAGLTDHEHPAVAPGGRHIAYYAGEYGAIGIYVCDLDGRLARVLSPPTGNSTQPAWHPAGDRIAYRHQPAADAKWELWETALTGADSAPRRLLAAPRWHYKHPYYDGAGLRLAYFSDEDSAGVFHLWLWELASGRRRQLTFGDTQMHCHPVFSPDGRRIAYHAYRGTDENATPAVTNLYELDLADETTRMLTRGEDQYKHPFYLTDDVLTCHHERNRDGRRRLCALHLASGELVALTGGDDNDKHPFPFTAADDRYLAWASKKRGPEQAGEQKTYDIFVARLEH